MLAMSNQPFPKGRTVSSTYISKAQSIVLVCALLAVLATCAIVVARPSLGGISPVCDGLALADSAPVGYRLP
jgi:hypothetical protein